MDPSRKRRIRLIVALSAALLLATALVYTSFNTSSEALGAARLASSAVPGRSYELTGKVAQGSVVHEGGTMLFRIADRQNPKVTVPVSYTGSVPDPFRPGREVIVTVHKQGDTFVGAQDSLVTKCPSKYQSSSDAQQS